MIHSCAFVHSQACVDETVTIGRRSRVWQFASVIRGAQIGEDCNVASGALVDGSRIGSRSIVAQNVAMGPGFLIGSDCFIGPNAVFANDAFPRASKEGWSAEAFDGSKWAVIMEDGASVGALCVVLPGVRIGKGAMIAAGARVTQDVPAGMLLRPNGQMLPITKAHARLRFARSLDASLC